MNHLDNGAGRFISRRNKLGDKSKWETFESRVAQAIPTPCVNAHLDLCQVKRQSLLQPLDSPVRPCLEAGQAALGHDLDHEHDTVRVLAAGKETLDDEHLRGGLRADQGRGAKSGPEFNERYGENYHTQQGGEEIIMG